MVPNYHHCKLPLLRVLSDGKIRSLKECSNGVADILQLSQKQREELQPNGKDTKIHFNVGWAKWHLEQEGMLKTVSRGHYSITGKGQEFLRRFGDGNGL